MEETRMIDAETLSPDAADILRIVTAANPVLRANLTRRLRVWHEAAEGSVEKSDVTQWLGWCGLGRWFVVSRAERGMVLNLLERDAK